jgi:uncharacterized Zn-binding protein involved in type VI secretion|tara:strand:+ start:89 stop:391 length:303 start_codon:yes stop_codon:yes gene_type:complete
MPAAARINDNCTTGHPCTPIIGIKGNLQSKVYINGTLAAVIGDVLKDHTILVGNSCVPHPATVTGGSSKVFYQGMAAARIGDAADFGAIIQGSSNTFAGG